MKNGLALALLATGALAVAANVPGMTRESSPGRSSGRERDPRAAGNPWALWQGSRNHSSDGVPGASTALARRQAPCPPCESDGGRSVDLSVLAFRKRRAMGLQ